MYKSWSLLFTDGSTEKKQRIVKHSGTLINVVSCLQKTMQHTSRGNTVIIMSTVKQSQLYVPKYFQLFPASAVSQNLLYSKYISNDQNMRISHAGMHVFYKDTVKKFYQYLKFI